VLALIRYHAPSYLDTRFAGVDDVDHIDTDVPDTTRRTTRRECCDQPAPRPEAQQAGPHSIPLAVLESQLAARILYHSTCLGPRCRMPGNAVLAARHKRLELLLTAGEADVHGGRVVGRGGCGGRRRTAEVVGSSGIAHTSLEADSVGPSCNIHGQLALNTPELPVNGLVNLTEQAGIV
jgi:hypothetical protein